LTPVQVAVIPISDKFNDYAKKICDVLKDNNIRVDLDLRSEKMGAKIRNAEINKVPIMLILGEKEQIDNKVSVRRKFSGNQGSMTLNDFVDKINLEIKTRSNINSES